MAQTSNAAWTNSRTIGMFLALGSSLSVKGTHTTFPAAECTLAGRRRYGARGRHSGEQERSAAVTCVTTHCESIVCGTHTTLPAAERTAPGGRLHRAWPMLFGHEGSSAAVALITAHGNGLGLRDLEMSLKR